MTRYTQEYWEKAKANPDKYDIFAGRITIKPHADVFDYESYEPLKPTIKAPKRSPSQVMYVDANRTQTIPQMNYWMFTLPVLVLAVVLIGGRK